MHKVCTMRTPMGVELHRSVDTDSYYYFVNKSMSQPAYHFEWESLDENGNKIHCSSCTKNNITIRFFDAFNFALEIEF